MNADRATAGLYLGLISGTSMDGIDAAIVRLGEQRCEVVAAKCMPYPQPLRDVLLAASRRPETCTVDAIGRLDHAVGECFALAALEVLEASGGSRRDVRAIGSHGQTLRHRPDVEHPYSLQIGDPNIIAARTGIDVVADFRRRDMAEGGQGAPLTPAFHRWLFADRGTHRLVLNIGGIANVTVLPAGGDSPGGFDTGPGNGLMDAWMAGKFGEPFDRDGRVAAGGRVLSSLLSRMLEDPYFTRKAPKSTGFEHFNLDWLAGMMDGAAHPPADVQATLLALTVRSIAEAVRRDAPLTAEVIACGGGVHNKPLMERLKAVLAPASLSSSARYGLDPDWVEAAAFAWLASRTMDGRSGNLPSVTGAARDAILGAIYQAG